MSGKYIPEEELMPIILESIHQNKHTALTVRGGSMLPFLKSERDIVFLSERPSKLKRGDILLFQRSNGKYIIHRFIKPMAKGLLAVAGDSDCHLEVIDCSQVEGEVTRVIRKGKKKKKKNVIWIFYAKVWSRTVSMRSSIFRTSSFLKRFIRNG